MKTLILSLGGSIIVPDKPDYFFLREFKNFVIEHLKNYRFVIVCGGGKTNSYYNYAASRISNVNDIDLDWIGIMASRLNAELVRSIFGDLAYEKVVYDPTKKVDTDKKIIIAAGYKPGCSTDYDAVLLAEHFDSSKIINLTNTEYVYDKDPRTNPDAQKLFNVSWKDYRKIVGNKWSPRLNSPFDPIASKLAQEKKYSVAILKGTDLKNLRDFIEDKTFKGTIITI